MKKGKILIVCGGIFLLLAVLWTVMIQTIDVKDIGVNGTAVGFSTLNSYFHSLTGVNMTLYIVTDWLGLVPIFVCMFFGLVGLIQMIKRRGLFRTDFDIILLGVYYIVVVIAYLVFEMIPVNYRPILIDGFMEGSYPSSTTLLVLSVMPTLVFQANRRVKSKLLKFLTASLSGAFTVFMVAGRLVSGVHWLTDIVGSVFLSAGLFLIYAGAVTCNSGKKHQGESYGIQ